MWVSTAEAVFTQADQNTADSLRALEPVTPQYDASSYFIVVKVNVFENTKELTKQFYLDSGNRYSLSFDVLGGYSNMSFRPPAEVPIAMNSEMDAIYVCEMNVVRPTTFYDSEWYVVGHEFGHCMYGQWHKPALVDNEE